MARPLRIEYPGAFYHIIQRGIEKKPIFTSNNDKEKFLSYLNLAHTTYNAIFHTYILMKNHYHLIIETPRGNLSKIMHYLNTSYAAYFNWLNKRVGPLYQGRYKAILVQQDEYLHHLSRYIHLNPVRANIIKTPQEYPWSSYKYFTSEQKPPSWLNITFILSMFDNKIFNAKKLYKQFVIDEIGKEKDIIKENIKIGFILGNDEFFEDIKAKFIDKEQDYEIPTLKELQYKKEPSLDYIRDTVEKNIKDGNKKLQRRLSIYLSRKYTQKTLNEIAQFYGKIKYPGISQAVRRTEEERKENKGVGILLTELERVINMSSVKT